jgi:hypothetical protein
VTSTALSLTYGLTNWLDIGAMVPIVHTNLEGSSRAQVIPFSSTSGSRAETFIAGTPDNPVLSSVQFVQGSATGVGDIAARMKINLVQRGWTGFSVLGDVRFPTGDEADFLGAGHRAVRALGVFSTRLGNFSPNASVGYLAWSGKSTNDGFLATVGFDQALAPWAAFAASFVSEFQTGRSVYQVPPAVTITAPYRRVVQPLDLPDIRDNALSVAAGFKFMTKSGVTALIDGLVPVQRGGPRPDFAWALGAEYDF